ncbi:MAG: hypothetical protein E7141_05815 [Rikenellaceae bacterium]|nr:hypothetical protein [Rikenellaceae bacterium]
MDYRIADFLLRTEGPHSDIVACGLRGFKPFEVETDQGAEPTMLLRMGIDVNDTTHPATKLIHDFDFEQNYAHGELARYENGYRFSMTREGRTFLLVKEDGSNVVDSNLGLCEVADPSLVRFGIWIMFGIIMAPLGGIAIHSSVIVKEDGAVLCLGESGTGKSTHTRLWRENIEGARLLNDDSPIIRVIDGKSIAYGSPWSGKTHCYVNKCVPIRALMRLSQAPHNKIYRLPALSAIGAILPSCPPAFAYDSRLQDAVCDTVSDVISCTPVYHLECLPNAAAAELSYSTIFKK